jgi:hypothetical protein
VNFFFQIFVGYPGSTANLGYACENLGILGPLVWEDIKHAQTVHKGLAKLLYRICLTNTAHSVLLAGGDAVMPHAQRPGDSQKGLVRPRMCQHEQDVIQLQRHR